METVRIGIIGCGGISRSHGRNFRQVPGVKICAVADPSEESRARFLEQGMEGAPLDGIYCDHRRMLEKEKLDGVLIASPHTLHFGHARDALESGCHVLVEKPMVTSTRDAEKLLDIQNRTGKTISVAFPGPFSREFAFVRQLVTEGGIGDIHLIAAHVCQNWTPYARGKWRGNPKLSGGGQSYDSGAHMFNAMLYLSGLEVEEVHAFTNNLDFEVDIIAAASIRFKGGALGTASVSGDCPTMHQGVLINGSKGLIKSSIYGGPLEYWNGKDLQESLELPERTGIHQNFADCIKGIDTTPSPGELGLEQARLMDAFYASAESGRPVRIPKKIRSLVAT